MKRLRVRDPKVGSGSYVTWSNWCTGIDTSRPGRSIWCARKPLTEIYQADLAKIGVTLNIKAMDAATWLARSGIKNVIPIGRQSFLWHEAWIDS